MAFVVSGKSLSRASLGVLFQPHDIAILTTECSKSVFWVRQSPALHFTLINLKSLCLQLDTLPKYIENHYIFFFKKLKKSGKKNNDKNSEISTKW